MFSIVIKPTVRLRLNEAYWWYEEQLPGLGERFLEEIDGAFEKLKLTPHSYSFLQENYRHLILKHFPYKVIFEIISNEVVIYALFHTGRNPETSFD